MSEHLIIEGNTVYEIDEECQMKKQRKEEQNKDSNRRKNGAKGENTNRKCR